jgi:hypothetical protein
LFCGSGAAAPAAIVVGDCELAVATVRYGDSNAIGSTIEGSAFSALFTRVEIGHIGIRSAGAHVKDVLSILRWCENPRDRVAGFRAVRADEVIE